MITQAQRMTVAEFEAIPDDGKRHELVRGELRTMPVPKGDHGFIEAAIMGAIDRYLQEKALALGWTPQDGPGARNTLVGRVGSGEVGLPFAVPDHSDQIRGADGVYIPPEQLARVAWPKGDYFPAVPALVVEVVSASDPAGDVAEKIADYLAGGARRVWALYDEQRAVHVHDPDRATRVVRGRESLVDEELLPGFALPLDLIFS